MTQAAEAFGNINALQIISSALPPLRRSPFSTQCSSLARVSYYHRLRLWRDFEQDVRQLRNSISWNQHQIPLGFLPTAYRANHVSYEHFVCGDEKSSSSRLVHDLFQMVGAVGAEIDFQLNFSDWKATIEGTVQSDSVPDFAILNPITGRAHAAGEIKTPWAHPVEQAMDEWLQSNLDMNIRLYLGQIAEYMLRFQLKYGFFSTYNSTVFLKQEFTNGDWVLSVSNIISFDTISTHQGSSDDTLVGKVSLRECMLYFLHASGQPDYRVVNNTKPSMWLIYRRLTKHRNFDEKSPVKETRKNPTRDARFRGYELSPGRRNIPIRLTGHRPNSVKRLDTMNGPKTRAAIGTRSRTGANTRAKPKPKARTKWKVKIRVND